MSPPPDDKKARKKALIAKTRKQQVMMDAFRQLREESDRLREEAAERMESGPAPVTQVAWGDKVAVIRNRLTDKKRASRERWNRFSGTGGEGGRGL